MSAATLVLRSTPDTFGEQMVPRKTRRHSKLRRAVFGGHRKLAMLLLLIVAVASLTVGGNPFSPTGSNVREASASFGPIPTEFCDVIPLLKQDKAASPPINSAWPGVAGGIGLAGRSAAEGLAAPGLPGIGKAGANLGETLTPYKDSGITPTAYEWWGTAGMQWTPWPMKELGATCGFDLIMAQAGTVVANFIFNIDAIVAEIGLTVFSWAFSIDAFTPFIDTVGAAVQALNTALYAEYLAPILVLATLWMAWKGFVKKASREVITGAFWMIGATTAAAIFFNNPTGLMKGVNTLTQTITDKIVAAGAGIGNATDGRPGGGVRLCDAAGKDQQIRVSQCVIWSTFVFQPWASGQFGPAAGEAVPNGAGGQLSLPGVGVAPVALTWLDATTLNHDEVVNLSVDTKNKRSMYAATVATLACTQEPYNIGFGKLYDDSGVLTEDGAKCTPVAGHAAFTGANWAQKVQIAFVDFFAIIIGMIPLVFLAFTMVVFQLSAIFLYLCAPIFLLLGVHPGFGRKIAMGWLEMLVSNTLKRIGTAILISVLLIVLGAITSASTGWIGQIMLIAASSIAVMMYRKKFLEKISTVSIGGDGGINGGGGAGQKGKQAVGRLAGMAGGGVGAGVAGGNLGGIVAGAAMGAMMGRGANPVIAARMGFGSGSRKGRAKAAEQRREEQAQEREYEAQRKKAEIDADPELRAEAHEKEMRRQDKSMDRIGGHYANNGMDDEGTQQLHEQTVRKWLDADQKVPVADTGNLELDNAINKQTAELIAAIKGTDDPMQYMRGRMQTNERQFDGGRTAQRGEGEGMNRPEMPAGTGASPTGPQATPQPAPVPTAPGTGPLPEFRDPESVAPGSGPSDDRSGPRRPPPIDPDAT